MKHTKLKLVLVILMIATSTIAKGQDIADYIESSTSLVPSATRYSGFTIDTEKQSTKGMLANPAFQSLFLSDSTINSKSYIRTSTSASKLGGDYHTFEGNHSTNTTFDGYGSVTLKNSGTLFGSAQFQNGKDRSIGWNGIRHFEDYSPYISTDSIGGDYTYSLYGVKGGYSFSSNKFHYGVQASFAGEQAHRMTDPRAKNTTSWLNIDLGAGVVLPKSKLFVNIGYERNKQHMTMSNWRPGQQDRYFIAYGFGRYDAKESRVGFGMSRMYYINGINSDIYYSFAPSQTISLTIGSEIDYHNLRTEESSIRDLYFAKTTHLRPNIELKIDRSTDWVLYGELDYTTRSGSENIFTQVLVDEVNHVYDFKLIDTQTNYSMNNYEWLVQAKSLIPLSTNSELSLLVGSYGAELSQSYTTDDMQITNRWVEPHAGIGYKHTYRHSSLDISLIYSRKICGDGVYNVVPISQKVEDIEFQHAFMPYAFYSNNYNGIKLKATYVYELRNDLSLGIRAEAMWRDGNRSDDVSFDKEIGFYNPVAPAISISPDIYNEKWAKLSLFLLL